jgi:glutathione S-transferase
MSQIFQLVSHHLCPYVQRAVIVAAEKGIALERTFIDLAAKPEWFLSISPTGKVPLLRVWDDDGYEHVLFESAAIVEFLDEISPGALLPDNPIARARHRAFVEFASGTLSDIASLYAAPDAETFTGKRRSLVARFTQMERNLHEPWFDEAFGMVDVSFGPVFRYLDTFEGLAGLYLVNDLPKVASWRAALSARSSVATAVGADYAGRLAAFLSGRGSHLSKVIEERSRDAA